MINRAIPGPMAPMNSAISAAKPKTIDRMNRIILNPPEDI
jgi:hypothetical protein